MESFIIEFSAISLEAKLMITLLLGVVFLIINQIFKQKALQSSVEQQSLAMQSIQKQQQELHITLASLLNEQQLALLDQLHDKEHKQQQSQQQYHHSLLKSLQEHQQQFFKNQVTSFEQLNSQLNKVSQANREELTKNIDKLTESTDKRLQEISGQVEKRLSEGFEKTTKTFNDILKRLALIDDAQKKITELSTNVVSLQEVLADKRSRGAFGEVQLNALIRNVLPEKQYAFQHTLSNNKIADCVLFLPKPTGNIVIDAKFPLESFRVMTDLHAESAIRQQANRQFKQDIKKHINDIASKYLIEHETADGAVMFIPAEAVFAEIHAHHSDLVEQANKKRVWLASPTTLMAILTTARAVIKDEATREQVHVIQSHLSYLAADFQRFQGRFNNLARHIDQAATDVKQIHTSAEKITNRFEKIEQVDLQQDQIAALSSVVGDDK